MHTIIRPIQIATSPPAERTDAFRTPHCDMAGKKGSIEATVYLPGVEARGVELLLSRGELIVTARRLLPVRTNWNALSLERCTSNYQLRIKTQRDLHVSQVRAQFDDGVLRLSIERPVTTHTRAAFAA